MGVIFKHDTETDAINVPMIKGKTVRFSMDYFEGRRVDAIIKDSETGKEYKVLLTFALSSADKDPHKGKLARIVITQLNGKFRYVQRLDSLILNQNSVSFKYSHWVGNKGYPLIGKISHEVGKESYIGFKTIGRGRS